MIFKTYASAILLIRGPKKIDKPIMNVKFQDK